MSRVSVVYFYSFELVFPQRHTRRTVPQDRIVPVYLLQDREDTCAWLGVSMLSACAAMNVF